MITGTTLTVLPNGNLKISNDSTDWEYDELKNDYFKEKNHDYMYYWHELLEQTIANSDYDIISPEKLGALTDSVIIGGGISWDEDGELDCPDALFWWFPSYMIDEPLEELFENGFVIFEKTDNN